MRPDFTPRRRRGGIGLLLFVAGTLLVIALTDLWIYRRVETALDTALGSRLESVVRTLLATGFIQGDDLPDPGGGFDPFTLSLLDFVLPRMQLENDLDAILLLDPVEFTIGYSSSDSSLYRPGGAYPYLATHGEAILTALATDEVTVSQTLPVGSIWLKCGFAPVRTLLGDGEVVAVLVVEASADFFASLARVRTVMGTGMAAAGILLLLLVAAYLGLQRQVNRARLALDREDRMAALGRLASQVAHEIRNPVGIIKYSAERMGKWIESQGGGRRSADPRLAEMVAYIEEETGRLQDLTERYLTYTREGGMIWQEVDPGGLAAAARDALSRMNPPEGIELELEVALDLPALRGDPHLLRQALLNLGTNALEALGTTGRVCFFARSAPAAGTGEPAGGKKPEEAPEEILLGVEDDGPGIPPRIRKRIYEPFFTTRADGNGLGLTIVREIVRDHGGELEIVCPEEGGTRASIRLPVVPAPAVGPTGTPAPAGTAASADPGPPEQPGAEEKGGE